LEAEGLTHGQYRLLNQISSQYDIQTNYNTTALKQTRLERKQQR